jgi:formyl-CoA transferase
MMQALEGIKVVDVSQVAAVPMAARFLADFGADVVHVEHPARGDLLRAMQLMGKQYAPELDIEFDYLWENYNRNKRGIAVDLSKEEGRGIILRLVADADILLSNLRPFEVERYRLSYEELSASNPRLIYGNLTGFGRKGAEKDFPGFDTTAHWGRAGIAYRLTRPCQPPLAGVGGFGDNVAALALYGGVTTALYARERTGEGQEIDVSLLHTGVYQLSFELSAVLATGHDVTEAFRQELEDQGITEPSAEAMNELREQAPNPLIIPYKTKDERWYMLTVVSADRHLEKLFRILGRDDIVGDPRFATHESRRENSTDLFHVLEEAFQTRTLDEWRALLEGIPSAPMQPYMGVIADPQARDNDVFVAFEHPTHGRVEVIANPVGMSKTPAAQAAPAPRFGEHTDEILVKHGYGQQEIESLRQRGIIA